MKVSRAIELLTKNHQPDEEILIEWWAKERFDLDDEPLAEDDWASAVSSVEDYPSEWALGIIFDQLETAIYEAQQAKAKA